MFRKNFERVCSLSSLYFICCKKKYYIGSIRCLRIHWAVFIKTFHFALIHASWDLIYCPIVGNHSNFRKYWFHAKQSHNVLSKQVLSKWTLFQNVLSSWEFQHITNKLDVRKIDEKSLSTFLLMFISSYYFH